MRIAFCFFILLSSGFSYASETDGFTVRYENFPDGLQAIDQEVNRRIEWAVSQTNLQDSSSLEFCSLDQLQSNLKKVLLRPLYGKIEGYINSSPLVSKRKISLSESIYKYIPLYENLPVHLATMGFGSMIHAYIKGDLLLIGADKFGHFFDQGFEYYELMHKENGSLENALNYGDQTEDGLFGLGTTGVKSYGDLTANYQGLLFWSNILSPVMNGSRSYLRCGVEGSHARWEIRRPFTFLEYLDAAWDEGVNCNQYRSPDYEYRVNTALRELKKLYPQQKFSCPAIPRACVELTQKYGKLAPRLLHPNCVKLLEN